MNDDNDISSVYCPSPQTKTLMILMSLVFRFILILHMKHVHGVHFQAE